MDILRPDSPNNNTPKKRRNRLLSIFKGMHSRCYYQKSISYQYYGAKGIQVCPQWQDFETFKQWALAHGYEETLTLDRIDSLKDYRPENCRWVTVQVNNDNKGNVTHVTAFGETKTIKAWTRDPRCLVDPHSLKMRLSRGYPSEISMQEPRCAYRSFLGPYEEGMPSKLTTERVRAIRHRYAQGNITITQIMKEYGLSFKAVYMVVHNQSWRHVQ